MIVLLDVDGVLADFHSGILGLIRELFGLDLSIEDFEDWEVDDPTSGFSVQIPLNKLVRGFETSTA